ncbi:hypothetical protein, partial [Nocardia brasiliensis]|uniref:hypothetical protein n=1 Tax=Nocardia brasiliensis TaxID=37326 RepID=UPI0024560239
DASDVVCACPPGRSAGAPPTPTRAGAHPRPAGVEIVARRRAALDARFVITLSRNVDGPEVAAVVLGST